MASEIETPEIDTINEMMEKLVGGYKLMSTAFISSQIAEIKERLDKASYEFGKQRDRITELESSIEGRMKTLIESAKTALRGEFAK